MKGEPPPHEPEGDRELPEPPDITRVHELRAKLSRDQARRGLRRRPADPAPARNATGRQVRDIGMFTIIPMMLLAGPAIGYLLGLAVENYFGGKPWPSVVGMLWGLAAAFRQIYLLLKRRTDEQRDER